MVQGLGCRVKGVGFRLYGVGFQVDGKGFLGFWVLGLRFRV
jgi:hypothetical protein